MSALSAAAVGCGSNTGQAPATGAVDARPTSSDASQAQLAARLERIERDLRKRNDSSQGAASGEDLATTRDCGDGVSAGLHTSCAFALRVRGAYDAAGGAATVTASSPVTGRTYEMA